MKAVLRRTSPFVCFALFLGAAACETAKSANPLSPQVAGPMEGIVITVPLPVEPGLGQKVKDTDQPVQIVIEEAHTNGPRAITMAFEIAADIGFTNVVFSKHGITPTGEGLTRLRLPDRLQPGRTYYWHLKADDGANSSGWSNAAHFEILQPISIGVPNPHSPSGGERVSSNTPEFKAGNGNSSGPHGALEYNFQIDDDPSFGSIFTNAWVNQDGDGETSYVMPPLPNPDRLFYWRVRISDGPNTGAWSRTESFRSPLAPAPPPPPPGGGGGGGGNGGGPCNSSSAQTIIECERAKYGFMSSSQIVDFLRASAASLNRNNISGGPYGILRKSGGHQCGGYSCDILCAGHGQGQRQHDVLADAESAQVPGWGGAMTVPNIRIDTCEIQ